VEIVADNLSEPYAFSLERSLIFAYRSAGLKLANLTDGGEGPSGHVPSPETIAKRAAKNKGQKRSDEFRERMSLMTRGKKKSPEHILALSQSRKGKSLSQAHREKLSKALKGRVVTDDHKRKISEANTGRPQTGEYRENNVMACLSRLESMFEKTRKPVTCIETGETFISLAEAAKSLGIQRSSINHVCLGKRKRAGGLTFSYVV